MNDFDRERTLKLDEPPFVGRVRYLEQMNSLALPRCGQKLQANRCEQMRHPSRSSMNHTELEAPSLHWSFWSLRDKACGSKPWHPADCVIQKT